ncbi:bifunctional diaminohydroxyphosphoribosylaminopyrimidine deaminase/5-amino-6-(5-phosphoribosylamino)uracil reductase RibD [Paludibacterium yongneupense]|uniref:bifunctional diaminohydroxyphosphoribosylaminopyrimidine deaminase/5-amino-6-(5-phosphoribosylamino)uracil reductase RibD n=1 Tax=Paludibacterium yongneupense TaxID=400061 RepID=UPI00040E3DB9|nr:bifunctional diaminohydroxyphosphoribosylaminopyrimidine deaminase/5-amino-6-(5-phosphoribosylamino)uracil reductase RibD [Paludibacterium yongneupense]
MTDNDFHYMQRALRLAAGASVRAAPNPGVGCVLVRDGRILGEGATLEAGSDHAEIQALKAAVAAGEDVAGATAYVTLEPCSHHGRTPPCADALIRHGIARVVAALRDPFPAVAGQGLERLRAAGVEVSCGVLESEAREVQRGFLSRIERGRPWVTLKAAASLDGATALRNGASQWITGPDARRDVHRLRARCDAILTGSGTVLADDPQLTVRDTPVARQPLRIVLDSGLRTSADSRIYQGGNTLLVSCLDDEERLRPYRAGGGETLCLPSAVDGRVDLAALLAALGARGVNQLMVEAGAVLSGALLGAGLVDELILYLAPSFLGASARGLFAWPELCSLDARIRFDIAETRKVGADLRLTLRPTV